ncbi:MAG: hypothetical protein KIIPBIDF_01277 [Candidatus Methanoperedenaceae archaeon GB50]|nr:MAG: hypothetical protein KIIPBIDF_01277 [Candidatus Methanoperedenaceae archaeon GB50]
MLNLTANIIAGDCKDLLADIELHIYRVERGRWADKINRIRKSISR